MRKTTVISLALLGILAAGAGCINTSTDDETSSSVTDTSSASSTASVATTAVTADSLNAKLTAAGLTVTTKDKSASIAKMETASAITKATELNINTDGDKVAVSVLELNDATKADAAKKQVQDQWALAKAYDAKISGEFVDVGSEATIVSIISKTEQAATVQKIKDALAK